MTAGVQSLKLQSFRALMIHVLVIFRSMSDLPVEVGGKFRAFHSSSDKLHSSMCFIFGRGHEFTILFGIV